VPRPLLRPTLPVGLLARWGPEGSSLRGYDTSGKVRGELGFLDWLHAREGAALAAGGDARSQTPGSGQFRP
jgi:hypothetical protein